MRNFDNKHDRSIRAIIKLMILMVVALAGALPASEALAAGGDILWQRQEAKTGKQMARRSVVDKDGCVIMTGYRNLNANPDTNVAGEDFWTVKFKADGSGIIWSKSFDKNSNSDQANAITIDKDQNIIVTGHVMNGTNRDIQTIKYDGATGDELWTHTYAGSAGGTDSGTAVTTDETGDVFVAGYSQNGFANYDYIVLRYPGYGPMANAPDWFKTYGNSTSGVEVADDPMAGDDRAASVVAQNGMVAVTGESWNGEDHDILTIRYNIDANTSWLQRYATTANNVNKDETGKEVLFDINGNVVITGVTKNALDDDIYTAKYAAATGNLIWQKIYNGAYDDAPAGMVIDSTGAVYITGYTWTVTAQHDFYTVKYTDPANPQSTTPDTIWEKNFNSYNGNDDIASATGIVVDEHGDVFVTGYTITNNNNDSYQTVKYRKSDGTELWQVMLDVSADRNDRSVGIGLDQSGNVLVAGWTDSATTGLDYHVVKYDPDAMNPPTGLTAVINSNSTVTLSWNYVHTVETGFIVQRCDGWECTNFTDLVIDPPLLSGTLTYTDATVSPYNYYYYRVKAINATNTSHFSNTVRALTQYISFNPSPSRYDPGTLFNGDDFTRAIAIGPDNNPVVTGSSDSKEIVEGIADSGGGLDYLTIKLDRSNISATPLWSSRYDSEQNQVDEPACVAVNNSNEVMVSGNSELFYAPVEANINSVFTIKYPSTGGDSIWSNQFNGTGGIDDRAVSIASGLDANNNLAVVGYGKNAQLNEDIYLIKYLTNGTRAWTPVAINKGHDDIPSAVAFDKDGNIFLTGTSHNGTDYDIYTAKYNGTTGALIWEDIYSGGYGDDQGLSMVIDPAGNPYVTGYITSTTGRDFYTIKYDGATKQKTWQRPYNGPAGGDDKAVAISLDSFDGSTVTVAGTSSTRAGDDDFHIIRYNASGDVIWSRTILRPDTTEELKAMGTDLSGNVIVAGTTTDWTITSALAFKLKSDGTILEGTTVASLTGTMAEATSLAVNLYGEAFIAGYSENADLNADYLVFKMPGAIQPPTLFTLTSASSSVTLNWIDNSLAEDGYKIQRKAEACNLSALPFTEIATLTANQITYPDSTVNSSANYCYRIVTYKGTDSTRYNEAGTLTKPPTPEMTVVAASQTQINLSWNNVTGETGYRVERKVGTAGTWTTLVDKAADVTTHSDPGLTPATVYYYRVMALNASGYSPASAVKSLPAVPVMTATTASTSQINLAWNNLETETGYRLERKTGAVGIYAQVGADMAQNSIAFSDTGLLTGTLYYYRLKGVNASGESYYSTEVSATTLFQAPNNLTASVTGTTTIALSWDDTNGPPNGNETGYQASYALCNNTAPDECTDINGTYWGIWTAFTQFPADSTTGNITGLISGRTYKIRMQALPNSGYTNTISATMNLATPAAPTLGTITNTTVILNWTDIAGETNYDIIQDGVRKNLALAKNSITTTVTVPTPNTTYSFQIYAYNSTSNATSTATSAKTTVNPTTLTSVTAQPATYEIKQIWADVTGESGYEIQRTTLVNQEEAPASPPSGWAAWTTLFAAPPLTLMPADTIQYTDIYLTGGYTYKYRVRYKLPDNSYSAYSNELYATTIPATPAMTVATGVLNWTNVVKETGYRLYQKQRVTDCATDDWTGVTPTNLGATTYSYTPTGLTAGTVYCYRLEAFNAVGASPQSLLTYLTPPVVNTPTGTTQTTIPVNWGNISGNSGYTLQWSTSSTFATVAGTYNAAANVTSYTVPGLTQLTTYYFRVQSNWSTSNTSFQSTTVSAITAPPTPGSITATPASTNSITASWSGINGATGYRIQSKEKQTNDDCAQAAFWTGVTPVSQAGISLTIGNLTKGAAYCIRVNSYNGSGDSPYSAPTTQTTLLDTPALAALTGVTASKVCLSWANVSANNGYNVERSTDNNTWGNIANRAKDDMGYCDETVVGGTLYYYRVLPKNIVGGYSTPSNVQSTTTVPSQPTTVIASPVNTTQISVTVNNAIGATGYKLQSKEKQSVDDCTLETFWTGVTPISQAGLPITIGSLTKGAVYCIRVSAINGTGESTYSVPLIQTTMLDTPTLNAPTGVTAGNICLSWSNVTFNEGYMVQRSLDNSTWPDLATTAKDAVSYCDGTVATGTLYYYRVLPKNIVGGYSTPSNVQSATTVPAAPSTITVTPASTTSITASWLAVTTATGYKIQIKEKQTNDDCSLPDFWTGVAPVSQAGISLTIGSLTKGAVYCIRVNASNGSGESTYSIPYIQTTLLDAPALAALTGVTTSNICLSWTNVTANNGYRVQRSTDNVTFNAVAYLAPDTVSYCDETLLAGTIYYYRVAPRNIVEGYSTASNVQSATTTPLAPAALTANVVSASRVDLSWETATGATKYRLERKEGSGAWGLVIEQAGITYQNSGLTPGATYTYRVMGWNATGLYSAPSSEKSVNTLSLGSTAITLLTPLNPTSVVVAWSYNPSSCVPSSCPLPEGYEIEMKFMSSRWSKIAVVRKPDSTSYTDSIGLRPGKTYSYRIRSYRGAEFSPYSAEQSVTTLTYSPFGTCSYAPNEQPHMPIITSTPSTTAAQGVAYSYQLVVSDTYAGDDFLYMLVTAPSGMTLSSSGLISWTPSYTQEGDKNVLLRVSDSVGNSVDQNFTVNVSKVYKTPTISSMPVTSGIENHAYSYLLVASDLNGDSLSYSLTTAPTGMTISSAGLISWTPSTSQIGTHNVTVKVSDGQLFSNQDFTVTVSANYPAFFISDPVTTATTGNAYSYQALTIDPEDDIRAYTLTTGPSGMTISSTTGFVNWATPVVGTHSVTITVSDGQKIAQQSYILRVYFTLSPPTAITASPTSISCGSSTVVTISWSAVTDPNGHQVQYQVEAYGAPQGWTSATSFQFTYPYSFYYRVKARDAVTMAESVWSSYNWIYDDCSGY